MIGKRSCHTNCATSRSLWDLFCKVEFHGDIFMKSGLSADATASDLSAIPEAVDIGWRDTQRERHAG